jgi:diadenosine tetraphosphate (Ap4A) HIT family hydrolase
MLFFFISNNRAQNERAYFAAISACLQVWMALKLGWFGACERWFGAFWAAVVSERWSILARDDQARFCAALIIWNMRSAAMFVLDSRLEHDTLNLGDFPLCRLLLMNDANYPWFILVPRREEISELFQLDPADQQALWREATALAETLKDTFGADKMNVATLGNMVSQLHMHVIARRRDDAAWPAPVWGHQPASRYSEAQVQAIKQKLKLVLTDNFRFVE